MSFDELVGGDDLSPEEEARLRRVHDLLVQAGPPAELPPQLERPPAPAEAEVIPFPLFPRRRVAAAVVAAAALVAVGFGVGFGFGHSKARTAVFTPERSVPMHGTRALAVLRIAKADSVGNWSMELEVTGLPTQAGRGSYYELWLTRHGKPVTPCGAFRVHGQTTTVRLSVPYDFSRFGGWVVTAQPAGRETPGRVVLTT